MQEAEEKTCQDLALLFSLLPCLMFFRSSTASGSPQRPSLLWGLLAFFNSKFIQDDEGLAKITIAISRQHCWKIDYLGTKRQLQVFVC